MAKKLHGKNIIQAMFFDLDGTLVDTMQLHYKAYHEVFREHGGELTWKDFDFHTGPPAMITIPLFASASSVQLNGEDAIKEIHTKKKVRLEQLLRGETLSMLPASEVLIEWAGKIPICVVTSGNSLGANAILHATGILPLVDVLISGDDVVRGKPDPAPYLRALSKLKVDARRCIAFEDHDNGIKSATGARLDVIDVRSGILIAGENV